MANPKYQARLREPLVKEVKAWQAETGIEKDSDAVRELLRAGLDAWDDDDEPDEPDSGLGYLAESVVLVLAVCGGVLAPLSFTFPALRLAALGYLALALVILTAVLWRRGVRPGSLSLPRRRSA